MVAGLSNGVAIDYDYYNDRMYWTDVSRGHIKTAPLSTGYPITTLVTGKMLLQHIPSPINNNFQNSRKCTDIQAANKMYAGCVINLNTRTCLQLWKSRTLECCIS